MALFSGLSEKLNHIFAKLTGKGKLTELEIKQAMREVRVALLEADVNFLVVKDFINRVGERAVGTEILESLTPGQQVVKLVHEELVTLMGGANAKLEVADKPPTVIMMCGLQGAGKTTMCGKLAALLKKQGKKPLLVACDIYRPAAIKQLQIVGKNAQADVFERGTDKPVKTAAAAVKEAERLGYDTVVIDTAGRLHIDDELMAELDEIKRAVRPKEILLTVDAMAGQDALTAADAFNKRLDITGVILSKLDGDTRGGAALSVRSVTGKPVKFCGIGEKLGDLEPFHPDRIAKRILGMGDVLTLIEKAESAVSEADMQRLEKKLRENSFTLEDYLAQFESLKKMGNIGELLSMVPGASKLKIGDGDIDERQLSRMKAIIQSMTRRERSRPEIIKASQRRRIAAGSGTQVQDVNRLLNQFEQTKDMMKRMRGGKGFPGMGGRRFR
ncbi:MAG: signal recognition particle protein [Clostridiales bacterium]|jgi:signal recognition particle subunit SRP54|nr:signal recognition particle protein [Clostridiales bacterium]